eukprot:111145-Hanusia_phi.AAC.3
MSALTKSDPIGAAREPRSEQSSRARPGPAVRPGLRFSGESRCDGRRESDGAISYWPPPGSSDVHGLHSAKSTQPENR